MDDQLKDVVRSKFDSFVAPVDDELWGGIEKDILKHPSNVVLIKRRRWDMLLLLLVISVTFWQVVRNSVGEDHKELVSSEQPKDLTDNQKSTIEPGKTNLVQAERVQSSEQGEQNTLRGNSIVEKKEKNHSVLNIDRFPSFKPVSANNRLNVDPISEVMPVIEISFVNLPPYQSGDYISQVNIMDSFILASDSTYFQKSKTKSNWVFGLNLNYLSFNPNPADQVYFEDLNPSFDLSFKHLGLNVGYHRDYQLADALKFRNVLSATLRQYKLNLNYIEDASDSENNSFTEFKSTFRPLSVGISTGLQYDLTKVGIDQKEIDLGLTYEVVVSGASNSESLVRYPKNQLMLNFGIIGGLAKTKWKWRVYGYHSLNKKFSDAPMHLTPFGFGLQFFKE